MTEQEKAALLEWLQKEIALIQSAQDEIPFGLDYDGENTLKAFNIALAALTSNPEPTPGKLNYPEIPDGWKLVPVELTPDMQNAWDNAPNCNNEDDSLNMCNAYRAMIDAAPTP